MDLNASKVFQRAVDSVRVPLEHFIKTGFYDPHVLGGYEPEDIADFQVRRVCRQIAKEGKRPFIRCHDVKSNYTWDNTTSRYVQRDIPEWEFGYVEVPKRKYLSVLVAPLLLTSPAKSGYYDALRSNSPVYEEQCESLWRLRVRDRELWDKYYDFVLNDPDCRKVRRLTS